jgi:hypothetical protein
MVRNNTLRPFIGIVAGILLAHAAQESVNAATYTVFSGQSIQTKINSATNGDTIVVFNGFYPENLTVNKSIAIANANGQSFTYAGTLTITNGAKAQFRGFNLTSGTVELRNASADFTRCTIQGDVNATVATMSDGTTPNRLSFTRCTLSATLTSSAAETFLADNKLSWGRVAGSGKMWMIGNLVDVGQTDGGEIVLAQGASTLFAYNNVIRRTHSGTLYNDNIGIRINGGAKLEARNNVVFNMANSYGTGPGYANATGSKGVMFDGSSGSAITSNLFLSTGRWFVYGPLSMNTALYNNSTVTFSGGIVPQNTLVADPLVVDTTDFVLGAASPARNAGDPDPRFNDIDGTRNDMGIYGGPFYDPEGRTGSKPVVLKAELDSTQFVRGELSTVKLKATGAATGAP